MRIIKFLVVLGIVIAVLGGGLAGIAFWHFSRDLPDYQQLADTKPQKTECWLVYRASADRVAAGREKAHVVARSWA